MVLRLFKQHAEPDHTLFYPPEPDIDIAPSAPPMLRPFDNESPSAAEILRSSHCLPALETLVVSMCVPFPEKGKKRRSPCLQPTLDAVDAWWDDLVQALSYRCDIGLRIRMLRIVGGWASDELYYVTAGKDAKMFAQAGQNAGCDRDLLV
ncbi:hypothetical protein PENSPDRAFT_658605 [Peniophora sp. CONT]|nr:hypothetical protein PENSPDRAFT_658605 [Peniophora sp. CONT]